MDKKHKALSIDEQYNRIYEKICFGQLKLQLDKCDDYFVENIEEKVAFFSFLVHVNTFVHKKQITGHKYDKDIGCIENLLVKCNLHSPEFLALLVDKHRFHFDTNVLLELLVNYADANVISLKDVIYDAIHEHDLIFCEDTVFIEWLNSMQEEKSTLIAMLIGEMDDFCDIGRFLNTLLKDNSDDPVNFVTSVFNFNIENITGSIFSMVESLDCLNKQDKQTLIAQFTHKFALTSKGKVKNEQEPEPGNVSNATPDDNDEDGSDASDDEDYSEEDSPDEDSSSDGSGDSDVKLQSKRSDKGKTSATKQRKINQ
jgi:hypothetical protein